MTIQKRHPYAKALFGLLLIPALISIPSCSRHVTISRSYFMDAEPDGGTKFKVRTYEKKAYTFRQYSLSNDTLIVYGSVQSDSLYHRGPVKAVVPLKDIQWMYRIEPDVEQTIILTTLCLLPFVYIFYLAKTSGPMIGS